MNKRYFIFFTLLMLLCSITVPGYASGDKAKNNDKKVEQVQSHIVAKRGDEGERVIQLQFMLQQLGHYKHHVDGSFGPGTELAVKIYQAYLGTKETGTVDEQLEKSLKKASNMDLSHYHRRVMEATAYSPEDPGCGRYTSTGELLRKGIIAVDPNVIPLGTVVYVVGYGRALAADTGGGIHGNIIDLGFSTHHEALSFGRRDVIVYVP